MVCVSVPADNAIPPLVAFEAMNQPYLNHGKLAGLLRVAYIWQAIVC